MSFSEPSDAELLRRFREGADRGALSLLFERHRALAYRVALRVLGSPTDAEDAAQDAFLNLLRYEPRVRPEDSLAGLVARMAQRAAQRLRRSLGRRHAHEVGSVEGLVVAVEDPRAGEGDLVRQAVAALPDRDRLPVVLHYFEGLTSREVADALEIRPDAARARLSRATARLRQRLVRAGVAVPGAALAALAGAHRTEAAPESLCARLEGLSARATPAAPTAAPLSFGLAPLALKAGPAILALAIALVGIGIVRRLPPSPPAGAASTPAARQPSAPAAPNSGKAAGPAGPHAAASLRRPAASAPETHRRAQATAAFTAPGSPGHLAGAAQDPAAPVAPMAEARPASAERAGTPAGPPAQDGPAATEAVPPASSGPSEAELRLAADICVEAWRGSAKIKYYARDALLVPLAAADPARAEALVAELPRTQQQPRRYWVELGRLRRDPQGTARRLVTADIDPDPILAAARAVAATDPKTAAALLGRAVEMARKHRQGDERAVGLAQVAAIATGLGDPRAAKLAQSMAALVPGVTNEYQARLALRALAAADPDAALKLVEKAPGDRFVAYCGMVSGGIAVRDPARARALLEAHRPATGDNAAARAGAAAWNKAVREMAVRLAARDPAAAEKLVRQTAGADAYGDYGRCEALATLAIHVPADRAERLRRDAWAAIPVEGGADIALRLAELLPPGAGRRDACARALQGGAGRGLTSADVGASLLARAAFVLAPVDREAARALLDDALGTCRREPRDQATSTRRLQLACAYVAVDPESAVALARELPPYQRWGADLRQGRYEALRKIALYLVTSPQDRVRMQFDPWMWSDITTPEEKEMVEP